MRGRQLFLIAGLFALAALLFAGLAAHYAAPGCDAAVAHPGIDLRFKNPYSSPVTIRASVDGDALRVQIVGAEKPSESVTVTSEILDSTSPARLTRMVQRPAGMG